MATHLFLTICLRFIQRYIPRAIKLSITRDENAAGDERAVLRSSEQKQTPAGG